MFIGLTLLAITGALVWAAVVLRVVARVAWRPPGRLGRWLGLQPDGGNGQCGRKQDERTRSCHESRLQNL